MPLTLRELKTEASKLARAGQVPAALAAHDKMLASNPLDGDSRRKIADLLWQLGDREGAVQVYRSCALHDARAGHLLPALIGCKVLESVGQPTDDIVALMAHSYAHGSPALGKFAARQAPVDLDAPVEPPAPSAATDVAKLVQRARARALDLSVFIQYPGHVLPVPFFSELPPELFAAAVSKVRLVRATDGQVIFREGQAGDAFYFVAAGELRVVGHDPQGRPVERAHLHEGALFGEVALLTAEPRTATVQAVGEADLIEVGRAAVAELVAAVPALGQRLEQFARERLLKNLLATSPLFKPFDHQQQMDLIRRFEGVDVAAGTPVIREGEPGQGLFVILMGSVEVVRGGQPLARLGAGDLFGEMALLHDGPTNATVRTLVPTSLLFLGRDYFRRLVAALPALRKYFEGLARARGGAPA
ncbi:MAG TPA: cyclic nucleotide-binding domain-containing protein [Polyangia bacterium]|nr:cyclic nucleotide-binding domain-containing protein [Polyangia bacterium]